MADSKDSKEKLLKELNKLSKEIDVEGLEFLVSQAKVLLHNMQINKVNAELGKLEEINREIRKDKSGKAAETNKTAVAVEEADDNFIIVLGTSRKFLSRSEMRKIVHICQAVALETEAGDIETEAALRLYRWFKINRSDILADGKIANAHSPRLKELFRIIVSNYRTKE
ncbi:MAG: hypothetical protein DRP57_06580 [Spirochaetes bacterium]|nr:MAG: hypothetical protein DRP57_06580 [Spirochaetota bacterium]